MWQRIIRSGERIAAPRSEAGTGDRDPRRAYYRIQAWVPVRLAKLAPDAVEAYGYDLQRIALRAKNDGAGVRP